MSQPTLTEVIQSAVRTGAAQLRVALPGRVEKYDAQRNACSVKPLLTDRLEDAEGKPIIQELPVLEDVPVLQLRGAGFSLLFPLKAGDMVQLLFNDRSLDRLLLTGQGGEPNDIRRHDLMDAVAIPGFFSFNEPPANNKEGVASIGAESATTDPPRIYFKTGEIALGTESPSDAVALASLVLQRLNAIVAAFNTHGHATACGAGVGTADPPEFGIATPASVASTTVKCK